MSRLSRDSRANPSPSSLSTPSATKTKNSLPPKKRAKVAKKLKLKEIRTSTTIVETPAADPPTESSTVKKTTDAKKKTAKNPGGVKAKYLSLITDCIFKLRSRTGSSRPAILNQLKLAHSKAIGVNEANINLNLKLALKLGLETGVLRMAKDSGKGSGSFKLTEEEIRRLKGKSDKPSKNKSLIESFFVAEDKSIVNESFADSSLSESDISMTQDSFVLVEKIPAETLLSLSASSPALRKTTRAKRAGV